MPKPSKLFVGYRALGLVSNHIPLSLRYIRRRNENLVVTVVGRSFHTYGCSKLNLLSVSGQHPEEISCLASDAFLVFTACKDTVYAWRRGNELKHTYKGQSENVIFILPFGPHIMVAYENNTLLVWDIKTEVVSVEIHFNIPVSVIAHPSTYLNKILVGGRDGCLQLWNLKTGKLIYTFNGWNSPVTVIEQAPAVHVVAIGLENGDIYIHNLKFDETIMKFSQDWGPVTAISFRTDGHPIMVSSSTIGHIAVWDLDKKCLHSDIRDAHKGCIAGIKFLPNEPLLITNSGDNSIKIWIFDLPDNGGQLLRLRDGHSAPPIRVKFYGTNGKDVISAGLDSTLRSFSTAADNLNKSLGQASFNRKAAKRKGVKKDPYKMLPVVDFAADPAREKDWDNVAAVHRNSKLVTTWSYDRSCMGQHKLVHERFKGIKDVEATCVSVSSCGNFVIIGYNTGHIDKYNMQSGFFRGTYGKETAHSGSVRGLVLDGFNQIVISGGYDRLIKFWRFKDCGQVAQRKLQSSVSRMIMHKESAMIAIALDDFSIIVLDLESKKIVREFSDNEGSISDMTFSPDCRWLIAATMDSSIKTWDLPTGRLIDWFTVSPICVSLTLSPCGEYLATAHAGSLGVYLWANATLYSNVSLQPLPTEYDPDQMDLPLISLEGKDDSENEIVEDAATDVPEFKSPEQISDELVTLSLLPQSHWLNLLDLDIIKQRNKPKEPVQVPKNAPFFLPVVSGLKPIFATDQEADWKNRNSHSKIFRVTQHGSEFFKLLKDGDITDMCEKALDILKSYSPSRIDVEIRCLSPENGGSLGIMENFLTVMRDSFRTNKNFELVHSYTSLFLQIHYETIACSEQMRKLLEEIQEMKKWDAVQEKINFCLCLGNYARSAVL